MAYTDSEARQDLLDTLAKAIDEIGYALSSLGAAYEAVDESSADKLEEQLFGPVQKAYGRAKRTHAEFASRHGLPGRSFGSEDAGLPSTGAKGFIEHAVDAAGTAGGMIATMQDSEVWLEVGDVELRTGVSEVRELIGAVPHEAREFVRGLGR